MTTRFGWHGRLAVATAALATLVVAAPAGAATTVRLAGGSTSVKLGSKATSAFKQAGIKVSPAKPAKNKGGSLVLPISGGSIDPATAKGVIVHKGGITLKMGKGKFTLGSLTLNTAKGTFAAKVGRSRAAATIGTVKGGKVARNGFATNLSGAKLTLNKLGAATINTAFGIDSIKAGLQLGTASVVSQPAEIALTRGTTKLTFTATTAGALGQLRVAPGAIAPATFDAATGTVSFPITRGTVDPSTLAGSIFHSGGLSLTKAGSSPTELTQPIITLSTSPTLAVTFGGASLAIADLDISALTRSVDARTRTISLAGAGVKLNQTAASALTGILGAPEGAFRAGDLIATASLTATAR